MKIEINDWVTRVAYPQMRPGFDQTYEHVLPCYMNRVIAKDDEKEAITLHAFCNGKYHDETFWAGNFRVVTTSEIIGEVVAASGGFDPLHVGHVEYLERAKTLGAKLVVIVNADDFLVRKKGYAFMPLAERMAIVKALRCVDEVVASIDDDQSVCKTLELVRPHVFAKGGDRNSGNIPEKEVCDRLGIHIADGLGEKIQSSSELVKKMRPR